jgi:hypothetical protein
MLFAFAVAARAETTSCGHDAVRMDGAREEIAGGCDALAKVLSAFAQMGFAIEPQFALVFRDEVFVDLVDDPIGTPGGPRRLEVSAFFDARSKRIEVTAFTAKRKGERRPWSMPWSSDIALSVLHHELVHMATFSVVDTAEKSPGRAWLEFVAYSVEFELMPPGLRKDVLSRYPTARPFISPYEVNPIVLAADPDLFGVRAHLTTAANGGLDYVRRLILGDVAFSLGDILWRP